MNLYYNDEHLAAAYKPYGVLSEMDETKPNMPALLCEELGCDTVYPVHRLDRTTQGLMVYAKTAECAKRLSAMVHRGEVQKTYLAVVEGVPDPLAGEFIDLLYFDRQKNKSYVVKRERRGVKQARLHYETLGTVYAEDMPLSLVKIVLDTGRTHQIRVQFASRKMPLCGDRRYGCKRACNSIQLCASELAFSHPFTGEELRFSYTPTNEFFGLFRE